MRIDHAIIGARDIEAVADRLWERHGLASLPGGRHPGWGTHNRIVPIAGAYVEIIGVADENEALRDPMGRWLLGHTATGDPLMGWCCETADIERLSRRLGLALERGGRERPDGSRLSWRVAGRDAALGARPFFIAWDDPDMRPGLLSAPHAVEVNGISRVEVGCSAEELEGWVDHDVPVRPLGDGSGLRAIVIATANGEIRLTGD
ncbi:MAG TPA: VOC family protein [Gaiellales bacterium]|nr:VOC family protein [Gaiellales bacterium]